MPARPGNPPPPPAAASRRRTLGICLLIFGATLLAYGPALRGGFIWDDSGHVTRPDLQSFAGLGRIWFEIGATQQYYPFLHSAFWLEHRLWGDAPLGYHLLNVLLHAAAACLLGTALRKLAVPGAWVAALLFALHPVCVESVAWISEQKNTLSAVLYLCSALAYFRFDERRRGADYALAAGLFLLALLTKTVTATLPAALLLVLWWRRGRLAWRRDVLPLLPWFAAAATAGGITAWFERARIGAQGADFTLGAAQRFLVAGRVVWFYLAKLAWPADLIFIYPRWTIDAAVAWQWLFPLGALTLVAVLWRARQRGPLTALLYFGGTLFPALGFFNVFPFLFSFVADHFQYLASAGILALAAAGLARLPRTAGATVAGLLLAGCGALTWQQCGMYRDVFTLYQTTIARNPDCWLAYNNLAEATADAGRPAEAIPLLDQALQLRPDFAEAESNLGDDLRLIGRPQDAIPHLLHAINLQPKFAQAHNNLGTALMMTNRPAEGMAEFRQAAALRSDFALPHFNLGLALANAGATGDAVAEFAAAARLEPCNAEYELNWAVGLAVTGRFSEARSHFERAIALAPDLVDARLQYGRALTGANRLEDAIAQYEAAVQIAPDAPGAHLALALAYQRVGRDREAAAQYQEARRLSPGGSPARE
ncbi:MAG TPA: tetratricopeptide repeat protein [Opitutaceae bacterium]|nr:tetratricopeptide repeat protein [Opitutaceae bacterium]